MTLDMKKAHGHLQEIYTGVHPAAGKDRCGPGPDQLRSLVNKGYQAPNRKQDEK